MKKITRESICKELGAPPDVATFSREELYKTLPSNATVAEIGVDTGKNAAVINRISSPKELYLIDPWDSYEVLSAGYTDDPMYHRAAAQWALPPVIPGRCVEARRDGAGREFKIVAYSVDVKKRKEEAYKYFADKDNVTILEKHSTEASKMFENHYFDWIHIDASWEYEDMKALLAYWLPKIKKGGYITGDQFSLDDFNKWPGVHGAIIEFIIKYIEKKPQIIDDLQAYYDHTMSFNKRRDTPWIPIEYDGNEINPILINRINPKTTKWYYYLTPPAVLEIVLNRIEHFPSQRWRGGAYKIQIGDWVDDLNYEEIIEDVKTK